MNYNRILKHLAVPLLLGTAALAAYATIKYSWNKELMAMLVFAATFFYLIILEQIIPLKSTWKTYRKEIKVDTLHLVSIGIFDALGKTVALYIVLYLNQFLFQSNGYWDRIPFLVTFVIANLTGEFLPYLYHRVSHVGSQKSLISLFLWNTHAIHHLPDSMNWFKTNWVHPINMFLNSLLKFVPLFSLGFSQDTIFSVGVLHVVVAYQSHANIDVKTRFLDYLIVTPQLHHFHHSKKLEEAKNFGNILPAWDLLFGTYYNREGGVAEVGVAPTTYKYPVTRSFIKQVLFPFRAYRNCCPE